MTSSRSPRCMGSAPHTARGEVCRRLRPVFGDRLLCDDIPDRYTRDASIFSLRPLAVAQALAEPEVVAAARASLATGVPLVARAGASNTGGAAVTDGLLLTLGGERFERVRVDPRTGLAVAGPAVRHDRLQSALAEHDLTLPSDPSSGPLSFVGGNIATRASGPHALRDGAINRYLREVRLVLVDGTVVDTREPESAPEALLARLGTLARRIAGDPESAGRLRARRDEKWASGYELLALLDHSDDPLRALPRLVCGSVGTLGLVTEAVLQAVPRPRRRAAVLLRFRTSRAACEAALELRGEASAIEIVSRSALDLLRRHTAVLGGDPESQALLIVEYAGESGVAEAAHRAARRIASSGELTAAPEVSGHEDEIEEIWRARKSLLPVIGRLADAGRVPYSVVNDVGVPPRRLPELIAGVESIFDRHRLDAPVYGHAGSGNLHLRPLFERGDAKTMRAVADEVYTLVTDLGGTITAEHGMGRLRAPFLEREWGARITGYMRELKSVFDPEGVLNPGVVFTTGDHDFSSDGWLEYLVGP